MSRFSTCVLLVVLGTPLGLASEAPARPPSANGDRGKTASPSTGGARLESLRLAIEDLIATFGQQYPQGREYLARLEPL
ncbi:MAG: hypothetical protein ACC645_25905, partial [Pirellulales bacterium]